VTSIEKIFQIFQLYLMKGMFTGFHPSQHYFLVHKPTPIEPHRLKHFYLFAKIMVISVFSVISVFGYTPASHCHRPICSKQYCTVGNLTSLQAMHETIMSLEMFLSSYDQNFMHISLSILPMWVIHNPILSLFPVSFACMLCLFQLCVPI